MIGPDSNVLDELRAVLVANLEPFAEALLGEPTSRRSGEWRWNARGSLAIEMAGLKRGAWKSHESLHGGGPFQLIQYARSYTIREAIHWAKNWAGGDLAPISHRPQTVVKPKQSTADLARRIWMEAGSPVGTIVENYLASRGLSLPVSAPIRFHPACPRGPDRLPAMLALMTDPLTAAPTGTHRTFLAPGGRGKADGLARGMLGSAGVIRLVPNEDITEGLGLAEGIETALSVMQGFGWTPVWATTSAGSIARFPILPGITALTIFSDADDKGAGLAGAQDCAARWVATGREARIWKPRTGEDFNDTARRCVS